MHALRKYVQDEMDDRGWNAADLVRASKISKQVVSGMLADDRESIDRLPKPETVDGLARAFRVDRDVILAKVGEAMGLPIAQPTVIYDASRVPNDALLRVLAQRLEEVGEDRGERSASTIPAGGDPANHDETRPALGERVRAELRERLEVEEDVPEEYRNAEGRQKLLDVAAAFALSDSPEVRANAGLRDALLLAGGDPVTPGPGVQVTPGEPDDLAHRRRALKADRIAADDLPNAARHDNGEGAR